jgi:hypothetical protein
LQLVVPRSLDRGTTLNVHELLKAVDRWAINGVLYDSDTTLQKAFLGGREGRVASN